MNMWYNIKKFPRSKIEGLLKSKQVILVRFTRLTWQKTTKYNLGGNILAPTAGSVLDLVFKARRGYENTIISGLYTL